MVTTPHSAQRKHAFLVKTKEMSTSKKISPRNKFALELLHYRLGHRYTRSLMAGDTENFWKEIEHSMDTDPLCTSCQIYSMNKNDRYKIPLKPK